MTDENFNQELPQPLSALQVEHMMEEYRKKVVDHLNLTLGAFQTGALRQYDIQLNQMKDLKNEVLSFRDDVALKRNIDSACKYLDEKMNAINNKLTDTSASVDRRLDEMEEKLKQTAVDFVEATLHKAFSKPVKKADPGPAGIPDKLDLALSDVLTNRRIVDKLHERGVFSVREVLNVGSKKLKNTFRFSPRWISEIRREFKEIGVHFMYDSPAAERNKKRQAERMERLTGMSAKTIHTGEKP